MTAVGCSLCEAEDRLIAVVALPPSLYSPTSLPFSARKFPLLASLPNSLFVPLHANSPSHAVPSLLAQ